MVMHRLLNRLDRRAPGILTRVVGAVLVADPDRVINTRAALTGDPAASKKTGGIHSYLLQDERDQPPAGLPLAVHHVCTSGDLVCDARVATIKAYDRGTRIHVRYKKDSLAVLRRTAEKLAAQTRMWPVASPKKATFHATLGEPFGVQLRANIRRGQTPVWVDPTGLPPGMYLSRRGWLAGEPMETGTWTVSYRLRNSQRHSYWGQKTGPFSTTIQVGLRSLPEPSAHSVYVAEVSNVGSFTKSRAQMQLEVQQALDFWREQSEGAITRFAVAEWQPHETSIPDAMCDDPTYDDSAFDEKMAEAADRFPGIDFVNAPNHLVVLVPTECTTSGSGGRGSMGSGLHSGGRAWMAINEWEGSTADVLGHELGHNLGLGHPGSIACRGEIARSTCGLDEPPSSDSPFQFHHEPFNAVSAGGNVRSVLNSLQRELLGITSSNESTSVRLTSGASQVTTMTLSRRSATQGLRYVSVIDPATGQRYVIEYRAHAWMDPESWDEERRPGMAVMRTVDDASRHYYDSPPVESMTIGRFLPDSWDPAVEVSRYNYLEGESFVTAGSHLVVSVVSLSQESMTVRIQLTA